MQLAWTDMYLQYQALKFDLNFNCGNAKDDWKDEEIRFIWGKRCVNSKGRKMCSPRRYFNWGIRTSCSSFPSLHPQWSEVPSSVMLFYFETSWSKCGAKTTKWMLFFKLSMFVKLEIERDCTNLRNCWCLHAANIAVYEIGWEVL